MSSPGAVPGSHKDLSVHWVPSRSGAGLVLSCPSPGPDDSFSSVPALEPLSPQTQMELNEAGHEGDQTERLVTGRSPEESLVMKMEQLKRWQEHMQERLRAQQLQELLKLQQEHHRLLDMMNIQPQDPSGVCGPEGEASQTELSRASVHEPEPQDSLTSVRDRPINLRGAGQKTFEENLEDQLGIEEKRLKSLQPARGDTGADALLIRPKRVFLKKGEGLLRFTGRKTAFKDPKPHPPAKSISRSHSELLSVQQARVDCGPKPSVQCKIITVCPDLPPTSSLCRSTKPVRLKMLKRHLRLQSALSDDDQRLPEGNADKQLAELITPPCGGATGEHSPEAVGPPVGTEQVYNVPEPQPSFQGPREARDSQERSFQEHLLHWESARQQESAELGEFELLEQAAEELSFSSNSSFVLKVLQMDQQMRLQRRLSSTPVKSKSNTQNPPNEEGHVLILCDSEDDEPVPLAQSVFMYPSQGDLPYNKATYEESSDKATYEESSDKATYEESSDKATYEESSDKAMYEESSDKATYEESSDKVTYEDSADEARYQDGSDKATYGDRSDKARYQDGSDKARYQDGSDKARYQDGSDKARYQDGSDKARYEDGSDEARYQDSSDKARYQDSSDKARYQDGSNKARYWDGSDKARYQDSSDKATYEDRSDKATYEDSSDKARYRDSSDKARYQDSSDKARYQDGSNKARYWDGSDKTRYPDGCQDDSFEAADNEDRTMTEHPQEKPGKHPQGHLGRVLFDDDDTWSQLSEDPSVCAVCPDKPHVPAEYTVNMKVVSKTLEDPPSGSAPSQLMGRLFPALVTDTPKAPVSLPETVAHPRRVNTHDPEADSQRLRERLVELEVQIERFTKENAALSKLEKEKQRLLEDLRRERSQFEQMKAQEMSRFEEYKREENRKLQRERKVWEQHMSAARAIPNKSERQEIQALKQQLSSLQEEVRRKESRWTNTHNRLRHQLEALGKDNSALREEVKTLEKLRLTAWRKNKSDSASKGVKFATPLDSSSSPQTSPPAPATRGSRRASAPGASMVPTGIRSSLRRPSVTGTKTEDSDSEDQHQSSPERAQRRPSPERAQRRPSPERVQRRPSPERAQRRPSPERAQRRPSPERAQRRPSPERVQRRPSPERAQRRPSPERVQRRPSPERAQRRPSPERAQRRPSPERAQRRPSPERVQRRPSPERVQSPQDDECRPETLQEEAVEAKGSRLMVFPNGTKKEVSLDGRTVKVTFFNGDTKEVTADQRVIYFYAEAKTTHISYPDGLEVLRFSNNQTEKHFPDGHKEITFPDLTVKTLYPDGREESVLTDGTVVHVHPDGSKTIVFNSGQKELHTSEFKRRQYPDGTVKTVYNDGRQETHYPSGRRRVKDAEGNVLLDHREVLDHRR